MKYLKKFELVTNELGYITHLDLDECIEFYKQTPSFKTLMKTIDKAKNEIYLWNSRETTVEDFLNESNLIFRQVNNIYGNTYVDYNIVDPTKVTRVSRFASNNIYNLLLSNLESWQDYPTRNKSLICGDFERAKKHNGNGLFVVVPFDTKVGVCPESDIWDSFKNTMSGNLNFITHISYLDPHGMKPKKYDTWSELETFLKEYKYTEHGSSFFASFENESAVNKVKNGDMTLYDFLNTELDPKKNNIKLINFNGSYDFEISAECWTESKSILIKWSLYKEFITAVKNTL